MDLDVAALTDIAIAGSVVVALVFGIIQVLIAVRDRRERLTIEVVRGLQTREFAQQLSDLSDRPPASTLAEWRALPESTRVTHIQFLQELEILGLLVFDKTIDFTLVERTLGSWVTIAWKGFQPFILDLRKQNNDPYMSEYFEWLAGRMETWLRDRPRMPAYQQNH